MAIGLIFNTDKIEGWKIILCKCYMLSLIWNIFLWFPAVLTFWECPLCISVFVDITCMFLNWLRYCFWVPKTWKNLINFTDRKCNEFMWENGKEIDKKPRSPINLMKNIMHVCRWNVYKDLQFIHMPIVSCSNTEYMNSPMSAGLKQIRFSCRSPNFSLQSVEKTRFSKELFTLEELKVLWIC